MKLAFILPGGVDRSGTVNVIPAWLWQIERVARRHELHVFALHQYPQPCTYPLLGATVHNLGWPRRRGVLIHAARCMPQFIRTFRQLGQWDGVHGWGGQPSAFTAACASRAVNVPLFTTLVGGELIALPHIRYGGRLTLLGKFMTHFALKRSNCIITISQVLQQEAQALGFASTVVPLGVDESCFLDVRAPNADGPFKLLHVASLNRIKDQPTLLRALQHVLVELPDTTLDIIGVDTLNGELQRLAEALGIAAHVRFHGFLTQEAVHPFWRQADLFVLSSLHEGQCVAVCEAAAAGVPTVGTQVGILDEWAPNNLAVGVPVGDATALANEIVTLLRDPSRRSRIATAAHAWATAHDADWTARQLEAIYVQEAY